MRPPGLVHCPWRCVETDIEIELSSQSYVDSTIFGNFCRFGIGVVGFLVQFEQIVKFLGLKNKR